MEFLAKVSEKFWNTNFWLPENSDWALVFKHTHLDLNQFVAYAFLLAPILYLVRTLFENSLAAPLGRFLNIPDKDPFTPNKKLEAYYADSKVLSESIVLLISKETGLEFDYIKAWFRARKSLNTPSKLQKFKEATWRFGLYTFFWIYGVYVTSDKSWFWDTNDCWRNYPRQPLDDDIRMYYFLETSFYFSLLGSQFSDVKRKDFWQMFLHHVVTLALLIFSLATNFQRLGSLVLVLHDTVDVWLEVAKMAQYAKFTKISDFCFNSFGLFWFLTRILLFPIVILKATMYDATEFFTPFPAYYFLNVLLAVLQVMHVVWFHLIVKVAYRQIVVGVTEIKDERSVSSEDEESQHEHKQ